MGAETVVRRARPTAIAPEPGRFVRTVVRRSPLVVVEDDVLDTAGQAHIRALGLAAETAGGTGTKHDDTGFSVELPVWDDPVLGPLAARIDELVGLDTRSQPTVRFRRYRAGESHPAHGDHFTVGDHELLATAMVTVGAPAEGGTTSFPLATPPLAVPAVAGRLTIWANHLRDGERDLLARHAGDVVVVGEKVNVTRFLYGPPSLAGAVWDRLDR